MCSDVLLCSGSYCCLSLLRMVQANLVKQLAKLVKVRYVEDITESERVGESTVHHYARKRCITTRVEEWLAKQPDSGS